MACGPRIFLLRKLKWGAGNSPPSRSSAGYLSDLLVLILLTYNLRRPGVARCPAEEQTELKPYQSKRSLQESQAELKTVRLNAHNSSGLAFKSGLLLTFLPLIPGAHLDLQNCSVALPQFWSGHNDILTRFLQLLKHIKTLGMFDRTGQIEKGEPNNKNPGKRIKMDQCAKYMLQLSVTDQWWFSATISHRALLEPVRGSCLVAHTFLFSYLD